MNLTWQQAIGIEETHLSPLEPSSDKPLLVNTEVLDDLSHLLKCAKNEGVAISIVSGFRSFERQLTIWNDKWMGYRPVYSRHGRPLNMECLSEIEKYKAIALWSALPGMSRHHWGTDFDIFATEAIDAGHQVELSPSEFSSTGVCHSLNQWLNEKLQYFGFFRPYKTYNQGVSEEPWHISHVAVSDKIYQQYPYDYYREYLSNSEIKSKEFICGQLEHYKEQYFCNFCKN